jgi:hypothetical protein
MASQTAPQPAHADRVSIEKQSQRLVTVFIASGMIFMLLPGTFLGVWNLIGISRRHTLESLSSAWLQAHGQAQLYGWIGSFMLVSGSIHSPRCIAPLHSCALWMDVVGDVDAGGLHCAGLLE